MLLRPRKKFINTQDQRQRLKTTATRECRSREQGRNTKETVGQRKSRFDDREEAKLWHLYF